MIYLSWENCDWYVYQKSLGHNISNKNEETLAIWHINDFDNYQRSINPNRDERRYIGDRGIYITYKEAKENLGVALGKIKSNTWSCMNSCVKGWYKLTPQEQEAKRIEFVIPVKNAIYQWMADMDKKWVDNHHRKDIVERKEKKKKLVLNRKAKEKFIDKKRREAASVEF